MSRDNFACTKCGDAETTLHVHHEKYKGDPWDCPNDKLKTICENCHASEHGIIELSTGDLLVNNLLLMKEKVCEPLKNENIPWPKQQEILRTAMLIDRRMMQARRIYG